MSLSDERRKTRMNAEKSESKAAGDRGRPRAHDAGLPVVVGVGVGEKAVSSHHSPDAEIVWILGRGLWKSPLCSTCIRRQPPPWGPPVEIARGMPRGRLWRSASPPPSRSACPCNISRNCLSGATGRFAKCWRAGLLYIFRDRLIVATLITLPIVFLGILRVRSPLLRSVQLAAGVLAGAVAGEWLVRQLYDQQAALAPLLTYAIRWGAVAFAVATAYYLWRASADSGDLLRQESLSPPIGRAAACQYAPDGSSQTDRTAFFVQHLGDRATPASDRPRCRRGNAG